MDAGRILFSSQSTFGILAHTPVSGITLQLVPSRHCTRFWSRTNIVMEGRRKLGGSYGRKWRTKPGMSSDALLTPSPSPTNDDASTCGIHGSSCNGQPIAIIGGGLAGLACGWGLRQRGLQAVIFDTGRRGPGGRASSRVLQVDGCQHVVDHAVQAFTVQAHEVRNLVEKMEQDGAARRWQGKVGTLSADGSFQQREAIDNPMWIGSVGAGIASMSEWLASQQTVVKDTWIAKLAEAHDGGWALLDQKGRSVTGSSYSYVVMAHNGKCADRLINTAPVRTIAHAPLRCRFTAKASRTADRLELSSLWVCLLEVPKKMVDFDGAFIEGDDILSWASNNSNKYPQRGSGSGKDVWTLISTPVYGARNKCPQESIPDNVRHKVSLEMRMAFGALTKADMHNCRIVHLQLWGAALPLNTCAQHFIHDSKNAVGVVGDWLSAPSVEGALFSGLALAEALDKEYCHGGLPSTGVKEFTGLVDCHAIGNFDPCLASATASQAVGSTGSVGSTNNQNEASSMASGPEAPPKSRWKRSRQPDPAKESRIGDTDSCVWYFGFGANINPWKLREQRQIRPVKEVLGRLSGWQLVFNHRGGMGNIEPLHDTSAAGDIPNAVHGVLLLLTDQDFQKLKQMEHEYTTVCVHVSTYDGQSISAQAFVSPPEWKLAIYPAPPLRYLKLIRDGCKTMGIEESYQDWLQKLSANAGQRGPEYWDVAGDLPYQQQQQRKQLRQKEVAQQACAETGPSEVEQKSRNEGPLKLTALAAFAVQTGLPLVDIGVNLGKCSPQDLAAQLVRAKAAHVGHLILTGCSVKSSQQALRICEEWSGGDPVTLATQHLGAAAAREMQVQGITSLPKLTFTAGVHPHDARTCDSNTLDTLREMTDHRLCVAVGECGLDYDRMFSPREVQLEWCRKQVELAVELDKPLFLHERDRDSSKGPPMGSARDLQTILAESDAYPSRVCVHCYTGSEKNLREYISRGYFIGLTGFAGMKARGSHIRDYLARGIIPLNQLMIETDCPFMMPDKEYLPRDIGMNGRKNEPCAMPGVCQAVAECLGVSAQQVANATAENSARFFGI